MELRVRYLGGHKFEAVFKRSRHHFGPTVGQRRRRFWNDAT